MTREYQSLNYSEIVETPAGKVAVQPLARDRVSVDAGWGQRHPETDDGVTFNGVAYHFTAHAYINGDGQWSAEPVYNEHTGPMMHRVGEFGDTSTPSAQRKAQDLIAEIVSTWAADNADRLEEAEAIQRNNNARGAEEQLARAEKYAAELRAIIAANDAGEYRSEYSHGFDVLHEERK